MAEVSCRVLDVTPTTLPVQLVFPLTEGKAFAPLHALHDALTGSWKTVFAYQFVLTAAPSGVAALPAANRMQAEMMK